MWTDIDTVFTVRVVDRQTGKQAVLYKSETGCGLWEYFDLSRFVEFEKSAALTQFPKDGSDEHVPVPSTRGWLPNAYEDEDGERALTLSVFFEFSHFHTSERNPRSSDTSVNGGANNTLTFLEKGLVYH